MVTVLDLRYDTIVMVSGGSGLTPFISITKELISASMRGWKTPKILLICAMKRSSQLGMVDLLLPSANSVDLSNLDIQIEVYVTKEKEATGVRSEQASTLWFKPSAMDAPISAILGPNSWLWLALIISASFVMFLIFLGILTQYYIYPIDHNTNKIYSSTERALFSMLFICASIAFTATGAFLWNKRNISKESNQIQNTEVPSPIGSPASGWAYNTEREMESLPHHSLQQCTNVHFGIRPDLNSKFSVIPTLLLQNIVENVTSLAYR